MHSSTVNVVALCAASICLAAQVVKAADHRDGPMFPPPPPGISAPASAADGPQPGYNPYVTVDYIEAAPGVARQETSLGSLHALGSVRQLELFANSRGGDQGSGALGAGRSGAPPLATTSVQPFQAATGDAAIAGPRTAPKLVDFSATGKPIQPQPTPSLAAPSGPATKPATAPPVTTFSAAAPAAGKAGGAVPIPNASLKRN